MPLARARLLSISPRLDGRQLDLELDFNPATLSLKISNKVETPGQTGRQQRQFLGSASSSLSFEAVFDTTRPKSGGQGARESRLDVRNRTKELVEYLRVDNVRMIFPVPPRVRFLWGRIVFDGVVENIDETLTRFTSQGTAVRSTVRLTITEQDFQYGADSRIRKTLAGGRRRQRQSERSTTPAALVGASDGESSGAGPTTERGLRNSDAGNPDRALAELGTTIDEARRVAEQSDLETLREISEARELVHDPERPTRDASRRAEAAAATADLSADLPPELTASLPIGLESALEVFGAGEVLGLIAGGQVDEGQVLASTTAERRAAALASGLREGDTGPPWAPAGPAAGSRAAALARLVRAARAGGLGRVAEPTGETVGVTAAGGAGVTAPLPSARGLVGLSVFGSPPMTTLANVDRCGPPGPPVFPSEPRPPVGGGGPSTPRTGSSHPCPCKE